MTKIYFDLSTVEKHLTPLELAFAEYLQAFHTGKDASITAKHLKQYGKGKELRDIVHALRKVGVPICSSNKGYYFAETESELYDVIVSLKSRASEIMKARNGMNNTYFRIKHEKGGQ